MGLEVCWTMVVWGWDTYWYHTLAVVVEVFENHLAEGVDLALWIGRVLREDAALLLEAAEEAGQLAHDALVATRVDILVEDKGKVEDELVALVLVRVDYTDGIADNALMVYADGEELVAELLSRDDVVGDAGEVEEWCLRNGGCGGDDGAVWDLVENYRAWVNGGG